MQKIKPGSKMIFLLLGILPQVHLALITTIKGQDEKGLSTTEFAGSTMMEPIEFELKHDQIIPDLLEKPVEHVLKVVYEDDTTVCFGNTLKAAAAQDVPEKISWHCEYPQVKFHTIVFVDLDVLSRDNPVEREWQHWIIGNIPDDRIKAGQTLTEYIGPTPVHGNGTHRFVFQLYLQKQGKIHFEEPRISARARDFRRAKFSSKEFAKKYALGRPYAVNYFFCTWPEAEDDDDDDLPGPPPPAIPTEGTYDLKLNEHEHNH